MLFSCIWFLLLLFGGQKIETFILEIGNPLGALKDIQMPEKFVGFTHIIFLIPLIRHNVLIPNQLITINEA